MSEPRITKVEPVKVDVDARDLTQIDAEVVKRLFEEPITLSLAERMQLKIDEAKSLFSFVPKIIGLIVAIEMKNSTKIATALTTIIIALLANYGIDLPSWAIDPINILSALIVGWLVKSPTTKEKPISEDL
jgi:hypothetical protein